MSRIEDYYDISNWREVHVRMLRLANELGQDAWAERVPPALSAIAQKAPGGE